MQNMMVLLGANLVCDELVVRRAWFWFASCDEIGSWSADCILYKVCDEKREDERDKPPEDGDVRFVSARADNEGPGQERAEGDSARINEQPC